MVDMVKRNLLADAIHELVAGIKTNDEFQEFLWDHGFQFLVAPTRYQDASIGPILDSAWCLYSDATEYRLVGRYRLPRENRRQVLRWIMFLRADLEYEWPAFRFINPTLVSLLGCLLSLLTCGIWANQKSRREFAKWRRAGDYEVWPFLRRSDYEAVYHRFCPFAGH
jgi:hypothetical protein